VPEPAPARSLDARKISGEIPPLNLRACGDLVREPFANSSESDQTANPRIPAVDSARRRSREQGSTALPTARGGIGAHVGAVRQTGADAVSSGGRWRRMDGQALVPTRPDRRIKGPLLQIAPRA